MIRHPLVSTNNSIKSQVVISVITGVSVMIILLGVITTSGINNHYRALMLSNAIQIGTGLAERSVFPLLSGSSQNAQDAMQQALNFQLVKAARIVNESGETFLTMGSFPDKLTTNSSDKLLQDHKLETENLWLLRTPIQISADSQPSENEEFSLDTAPISPQIIGFVDLTYSKEQLSDVEFKVALTVFTIGLISVFLMSITLWFGLNNLFNPLGKLVSTMQTAKETGEHNYAEIEGAKEIRYIASAYNGMMHVLDEQDERLKKHRDLLEQEIEVRTKEIITARDDAILASQHKSEFMANLSHELRTPIQSIIGYGELVTEELELEGNFALIDDMDKISTNSTRLLSLINNLLDLAKIEAGRMDLSLETIKVSEFVKEITDVIHPLAQSNCNKFILFNKLSLDSFLADRQKLEQVMINLLSNACKFTTDGEVNFIIQNDSNNLRFDVIDNGVGLSADHIEFIFEEFRQVDGSQRRKFSGTGLGLAISKRFIELMKGKITVKSELSHGAQFTVTIPLQ